MFAGDFLRQLCFDQVIRLLHVVRPFLAAELVDVFNEHPFVTRDVRRWMDSRRVREFIKLVILHFERDGQWSIQGSNAKHLTRNGETQVVSPLDVFRDRRKLTAEVAQALNIHPDPLSAPTRTARILAPTTRRSQTLR